LQQLFKGLEGNKLIRMVRLTQTLKAVDQNRVVVVKPVWRVVPLEFVLVAAVIDATWD
jgi:hypothetical protein